MPLNSVLLDGDEDKIDSVILCNVACVAIPAQASRTSRLATRATTGSDAVAPGPSVSRATAARRRALHHPLLFARGRCHDVGNGGRSLPTERSLGLGALSLFGAPGTPLAGAPFSAAADGKLYAPPKNTDRVLGSEEGLP